MVELAVVLKKLVVVPAVSESVPRVASCENRLVDDAVVLNKFVLVALPSLANCENKFF